jgi:EAL and modified HD-GYP domain-containing signal transduction protein
MNQAIVHDVPVVIARQPIFDREYKVCAYELLFRGASHHANADLKNFSADVATSRVINYAFLELGIERVIGKQTAFINLTRSFILSDEPIPMAQDQVVLELLEDIEVDEELLNGVKQLKQQGYAIALDDFVYHESLRPLIELASIVKVDILQLNETELREHIVELKKYDVKLLAEKVETLTDYELCFELGFDYFQGFFFCRPDIIEGSPIPDNQIVLLQLIQKLQDTNVEFKEVEELISRDAGLTYKLLRLLNSAALALPRQINSIREGLIILGIRAIRTWTTLIVMSDLSYTPRELLDYALIRAKMCESLAGHYDCSAESGFMVGLFSVIDAMLNRPMAEIIKPLQISDATKQALTHRQGDLGRLLKDIIHYEQGQWDEINEQMVTLELFSQRYIEAAEWSNEAIENI